MSTLGMDAQEPFLPRSKFTLRMEEDRHNLIRTIPSEETQQGSPSASGSLVSAGDSVEKQSDLHHLSLKAKWYMSSHPGNDCAASNVTIHGLCDQARRPEKYGQLSKGEIKYLTACLDHRIGMTKLATRYKDYLKITFKNCDEIDASVERKKLTYKNPHLVERLRNIRDVLERYYSKLFEDPIMGQGPWFGQIGPYMVLALHSSNWTLEEIDIALKELSQLNMLASKDETNATLKDQVQHEDHGCP